MLGSLLQCYEEFLRLINLVYAIKGFRTVTLKFVRKSKLKKCLRQKFANPVLYQLESYNVESLVIFLFDYGPIFILAACGSHFLKQYEDTKELIKNYAYSSRVSIFNSILRLEGKSIKQVKQKTCLVKPQKEKQKCPQSKDHKCGPSLKM